MNFDIIKKHPDKIVVRKLKDMADRFKNIKNINSEKIIYRVFIKDFITFEIGITVIEPGNINDELFMTKGHRHIKKREECYLLLKGKGKLLLEGKTNKTITLQKNKTYIIPATAGHRLINTGNKKLEVATIYSKDAGHDYQFKFKKRFFKK